jgi:hypothetical protein
MTQPERQAAGAPSVPRSQLLLGLAHAVRLALVIAIGLLGWALIQTGRDLLATPAPAPEGEADLRPLTPPARQEEAAVPSLGELLPGGWSLGDSAWSCACRLVGVQEMAECLRVYGEQVETGPRPAALERTVLQWLKTKARQRAVRPGLTEYQLLVGPGRLRAVSQGAGTGERLRLVQVLSPAGGQWKLVEVMPRKEAAGSGGGRHLLPMPPGAPSAARRWDQQGGLGAELVGPASAAELTETWRQAGWSVERADPRGGPGQGLVCRKDGETILVWKWGPAGAGANEYVLLVPAAAAGRRGGS